MTAKLFFSHQDKVIQDSFESLIAKVEHTNFFDKDQILTESNVHDARVFIRQLKSLLYFFRPLIKAENYKESQKLLSEGIKVFEAARDNSVLRAGLLAFKQQHPVYASEIDDVAKMLGTRWKADLVKISGHLTPEGYIPELIKWTQMASGDYLKAEREELSIIDFSEQRMAKILSQWIKKFAAADLSKRKKLHKSRVACKKIRYSFRALEDDLLQFPPDLMHLLEDYQTVAGELHDFVNWRSYQSFFEPALATAFLEALSDREVVMQIQLEELRRNLLKAFHAWIIQSSGITRR